MEAHDKPDQHIFSFDRIYLKDISFESPLCPQIFAEQPFDPKIDIQLHISHQLIDNKQDTYEVVLKTTVTAKAHDKIVYLVEIQQAGIFTISGFATQELEKLLEANCPNALFPFLREKISTLVNNGGFPTFLLQPINFEAMYQQKKMQENGTPTDSSITH